MRTQLFHTILLGGLMACLPTIPLAAQHSSVAFALTFEEPDSLLINSGMLQLGKFRTQNGIRKNGIALLQNGAIEVSSVAPRSANVQYLFWFQLNDDVRTYQTLFHVNDSLGTFSIFIEKGAVGIEFSTENNELKTAYALLPNTSQKIWQALSWRVERCMFTLAIGCQEILTIPFPTLLFARNTDKTVLIGNNRENQPFLGNIDEVMGFHHPLSTAEFRSYCSQQFLLSYLPISSTQTPDELASAPQPADSSQEENTEFAKPYQPVRITDWEVLNSTEQGTHTLPFNAAHFTLAIEFFRTKDARQPLFTLSSLGLQYLFVATEESFRIERTDLQGKVDSVLFYTNLSVLHSQTLILEMKGCTLSLYQGCELVGSRINAIFNLLAQPLEVTFTASETGYVQKLQHYPAHFNAEERATRFCADTTNAQGAATKHTALRALFNSRKSYLQPEPVVVPSPEVLLSFWDFDRIDGDTVSALWNDEVILAYHGLTRQKVTHLVALDTTRQNVLKILAHSNGTEGNNTVKVSILSGGGYYQEVDISTETLLNGGFILEYRPPLKKENK